MKAGFNNPHGSLEGLQLCCAMTKYALTDRFKLYAILFASVAFCGMMTLTRVYVFNSWSKVFLLWNLFLAIIPFVTSSLLAWLAKSKGKTSAFVFYPLAALWLLFFPNAPYVLTDLIHLRPVGVPLWYELFCYSCFPLPGRV
jgi:hypothetical protein